MNNPEVFIAIYFGDNCMINKHLNAFGKKNIAPLAKISNILRHHLR